MIWHYKSCCLFSIDISILHYVHLNCPATFRAMKARWSSNSPGFTNTNASFHREWNSFLGSQKRGENIVPVFSCDQAALWMVQSVRPSVCPSVTPFWLCSHHRIIMKFSGVITSDAHAKGHGQRSVKVTEVTTQLNRFRTVTPVEFTYDDEMMHKAWYCLGEVPYCFSRSSVKFQGHTAKKNRPFWPRFGVSGL